MEDFNTKVIEEFRANEGKVGGMFADANMILLHHTGRKSGSVRVTPLVWFPDGDRVLIVASKGGAPTHPEWYLNLVANPRATVEIGGETREVQARELDRAERDQQFTRIVGMSPGFGEYQEKTDRIIPILVLDPVS